MNPAATRADFVALDPVVKERYTELLKFLAEHSLPVRCEKVGRDFVVIVGPGFGSATHWLNRFDVLT